MSDRDFAIAYNRPMRALMTAFGLGPRSASVTLDNDQLEVRMGWAFRAVVARRSIVEAKYAVHRPLSIGVHGWRGAWLINGSRDQIVVLTLTPAARGRVCGLPVRITTLAISVATPAALVAVLTGALV